MCVCQCNCCSGRVVVVGCGVPSVAEANDVFMVYPRIQPWGTTVQQQSGCWDAYAQTGANYAWRDGVQMQGVRNMVRVVAGV